MRLELSLRHAQRLQLAAQGLLSAPPRRICRDDVMTAIERMRLLQIDSINVVARSPYLVLHARLGDYEPIWLDELLAAGRLVECWAHEACFVTANQYALHHAWRDHPNAHRAYREAKNTYREHRREMNSLLARIHKAGPVRAADFTSQRHGASNWWAWKPQKQWLEAWFALGNLMILRRERFQRVYDLSERVLSRLDPPFNPLLKKDSTDHVRRCFVLNTVRALGVTQASWIADYYRLKPAVDDRELSPFVEAGDLIKVEVEGWKLPGYVHCDHAAWLSQVTRAGLRATHTALLSPFDPLVWDRSRVQAMFDFTYSIECYTPATKRRFGYYVLPILHRGRLIGRLDAKAHRSEGVFEIKSLYMEPGIKIEDRLLDDLAKTLKETARWHATPTVKLTKCEPHNLNAALRATLRRLF